MGEENNNERRENDIAIVALSFVTLVLSSIGASEKMLFTKYVLPFEIAWTFRAH